MNIKIEIECEVKDSQVKEWEDNVRRYYNLMYNNDAEKVDAVIKENDFCSAVSDEVSDLIENNGYICNRIVATEIK